MFVGAVKERPVSVGQVVRKSRLEMLGMGSSCHPQVECLLPQEGLGSVFKASQVIQSGSPRTLRIISLKIN